MAFDLESLISRLKTSEFKEQAALVLWCVILAAGFLYFSTIFTVKFFINHFNL